MKITLWISEETLKQFNSGEPITGNIFKREPGEHVDVLQVQVSDEYYQIQDDQNMICECSLPEGAEWDKSYSLEESTHSMHDIKLYTFQDVYDITRSTPNDMELGGKIREMVNGSDE